MHRPNTITAAHQRWARDYSQAWATKTLLKPRANGAVWLPAGVWTAATLLLMQRALATRGWI